MEQIALQNPLLTGLEDERTPAPTMLAIPPFLYADVGSHLGSAGLQKSAGYTRIIVEKPFGKDLNSAHELNRRLREVYNEAQIYRIDHYLGKETVQNIAVFRFANAIF